MKKETMFAILTGMTLLAGAAFAQGAKDDATKAVDPNTAPQVFDGGPGGLGGTVAVPADSGTATKPKWDKTTKTDMDKASEQLGKETTIQNVEPKDEKDKKDEKPGWFASRDWGGVLKGAILGGVLGGLGGWLLGGIGAVSLFSGWGILIAIGGGLLIGGLMGLFKSKDS